MSAENSQQSLCGLSLSELADWCEQQGEGKYRAAQIRRWLFGKRVTSFEEMHDVSKSLREKLEAEFVLFESKPVAHQVSKDRTEKLLLELHDGERVECVLMRETNRTTVCISTQVGCAMACVFCASGLLGLTRNLSSGEILEQVLQLDRLLGPDERISNVVVMGIGEPLQNLPALLPALDTLNDKGGLGIGARRITISTVGLPAKIRELAKHGRQYKLAVSLHAPNDRLRTELVPPNKNIGIDQILAATDEYLENKGRRVTYEYVMLEGRNDHREHARELADLLRGQTAHVNLIPMNPVEGLSFKEPSSVSAHSFAKILEDAGVPATIRKRKGEDIDAACGQLRLKRDSELVQIGIGEEK
ncbi:MAG: 23S rRNA (adenine(2503)-C(2))-methyltransferase RlmN [Planctomycetaceae bacterium]